jgi:hypothetical protein
MGGVHLVWRNFHYPISTEVAIGPDVFGKQPMG